MTPFSDLKKIDSMKLCNFETTDAGLQSHTKQWAEETKITVKKIEQKPTTWKCCFKKNWFSDVITAFLYVFQCGTLTSSVFVQFSSNRLSHVLQLIALYGIANQRFRFISSIENNGRKNGKPVKTKICENRKTKRWFTLIWHCWWRIWPYLGRPLHNWPLK